MTAHFGNGDGTFQDNPPLELFLASPDVVGVADVDMDGHDDIIFTGGGPNVFRGDGMGGFTATSEAGIGVEESMLIADIDDDGFADFSAAVRTGCPS